MLAYVERVAVAGTRANLNTSRRSSGLSKDSRSGVNSVLQSRVHRSEVWRRRFGSSPKISTTVENIVENTSLYLSPCKSCGFSGVFTVQWLRNALFSGLPGLQSIQEPASPAAFRRAKVCVAFVYRV